MMKGKLSIFLVILLLVLSGCATIPTGPSVMVMPPAGKSFEQFQADDAICRQFAYEQVGGVTGQEAAQRSAVSSAVIGTALGAAAGAAIGSASGNVGAGAAIGAGSGLLLGSAAGTGYASGSYYESQRRYDNAYMQCMYAKGNQIPGTTTRRVRRVAQVPPPPDLRTVSRDYYPPPYSSPPPSPAQPKVIDKITLMIHFDIDKSNIRKSDEAELKRGIDFVKRYPGSEVRVEGHTDSAGTDTYNQKLSERRAEAVKNYLVQKGAVDASKITSAGYGETRPVASNKTEQGKAQNRRVEILILSD